MKILLFILVLLLASLAFAADPNTSGNIDVSGVPWLMQVLAIIGGLYTVARAVVILTPSQKDDEYIAKAGGILGLVGKLFGLDLTQGINKK